MTYATLHEQAFTEPAPSTPSLTQATEPTVPEDNTFMDVDGSSLTKGPSGFRHNALALVAYPWATGIVMKEDLSSTFEENHYAFVSVFLTLYLTSKLPHFSVVLCRSPTI